MAVLWWNNVLKGFIEQLMLAVAQHATERGIDESQSAVGGNLYDSNLRMLI